MSRPVHASEVLGNPEHNGIYRVSGPLPSGLHVAGGCLTGKQAMLEAIAAVLAFPDYFGFNWDALDECLSDLEWFDGPVVLVIEDAGIPETQAPDAWNRLLGALEDAARFWRDQGRTFAIFLDGGHAAYPIVSA